MAVQRQRWATLRLSRMWLRVLTDAESARSFRPTAPPTTERTERVGERLFKVPHPHILSEELFRSSMIRQRQRADRTGQPLVVMLVKLNDRVASCRSIWEQTIAAVAAATRETDILGWFERGAVIGVIFTDLDVFDGRRRSELEAHLHQAISRRLDSETAARLSIRIHMPSQSNRVGEEGLLQTEPLLRLHAGSGVKFYAAIKRGLDIVGSLTLLVALAPLFALIAAAVKLTSPGPALFRQVRVGQMMKTFTILKFRTMAVQADHAIHYQFVSHFIQAGERVPQQGHNDPFKITNDPRVTRIGRVLRKTSLDELPQLWNVLRGEMSLVGPRPPIPYEVEQYKSWHCRRVLEAKPGITGLWQVTGRSRTTFDDMVRLDIRYARMCSLSTDLKILLATPRAVVAGKGAH